MESGIACFGPPPLTGEALCISLLKDSLLTCLDIAKAGYGFDDKNPMKWDYSNYKKTIEAFTQVLEEEQKRLKSYFAGKGYSEKTKEDFQKEQGLEEILSVAPFRITGSILSYSKDKLGYDEKAYCKTIGDLHACCENILKASDKRLGFGSEAEVYENIVKNLGAGWNLFNQWG